MSKSERVVLIDGSSLIFRAFYGLPEDFATTAGLPTSATYGFALMFRKIMAGRTPAFGAVVFDAPGGTFRDEMYAEYKADRPRMPSKLSRQIPWIHKVVEAHDFPTLSVTGYEADDVIGTLTRQAVEAGHEVRIIAPDKDFVQLIGPQVKMIDTMRDITYDEEVSRKKWGVPTAQFIDFLALLGDKVDNVPGVPGIGKKGAAKLLETYGSLDAILENVEQLKGRQKTNLVEYREQALLSRDLVRIDQHVPLEVGLDEIRLPEVDKTRVNTLYRELEFNSLLDEGEGTHEAAQAQGDYALTSAAKVFHFVSGATTPVAVMPIYELAGHMSALHGVALSAESGVARYLLARDLPAIGGWLADASKPKLCHDTRDAWTALTRAGFELAGVVGDTALAAFLCERGGAGRQGRGGPTVGESPSDRSAYKLDKVVRAYLQRTMPDVKTVLGAGKAQTTFAEADAEKVAVWACHRASSLVEAWTPLKAQLEADGQVTQLLERDLPLAYVLGGMQFTGIKVDADSLAALGTDFGAERDTLQARVHEIAGRAFNLRSTKQLAAVLFEELELPVIKRTKTGYSTNAEVLETLASKGHEIAQVLLRWRTLDKLISTYTAVLQEAVTPDTGRIHPTFQQTASASGRLITYDPDLQRTPTRTPEGRRIREAFVPQEGWVLVSADWSQIELRVLAHVCGDPMLVEAYQKGIDVHARTAATVFDLDEAEVTKAQREQGKTINFATIYGQGPRALGQSLGISMNEAKAVRNRYFERYAGVVTWLEETRETARQKGYVETIFGRRRYIPELTSREPALRSYGERIATNTPIQGSAADLCKLAMLQIAQGLEGMQARMLLQIHDELVFECPPEELEALCDLVRDRMENCYPMNVPLRVSMGSGKSWAEAH